MPSWTCSICQTEKRWPTKQPAMDHLREEHLDSLIRAGLERSDKDPTEKLQSL